MKPLLTVGGVDVFWDGVKLSFTADMDVDADGANGQHGFPVAYRLDDLGLDALRNAGFPYGAWHNVLAADPKDTRVPYTDKLGYCVSKTALDLLPGSAEHVRERWVDSFSVPYVVLPPEVIRAVGPAVLGCACRVAHQGSGYGTDAVVADVGPRGRIGEASMAAAKACHVNPNPRVGGDNQRRYLYEIYPGMAAEIDGVKYNLQPS